MITNHKLKIAFFAIIAFFFGYAYADGISTSPNVTSVAGKTGTVTLACIDLTNSAASCSTDATNATNITSGTLPNTRLASVPNSALANSSTTIGSTNIALGSSSTSLDGLTSVKIPTNGANPFSVGTNANDNGVGLSLLGSSAGKNWFISNNFFTGSTYEITPSTSNGGTTFTTPVFKLGSTGNLTLLGSITLNSATLLTTTTTLTNGSGSSAGTLTNAPAVGNPTKWIPINDNGTTRYIPAW